MMKKYDDALKCYTKMLEIDPGNDEALNGVPNIYRLQKNYDKAFEYIYKCLEINPAYNIAYATLAEIYAAVGNTQEFYLNLEKAFMTTPPENMANFQKSLGMEDIYLRFAQEERFRQLFQKYNAFYVYEPLPDV